MKERPAIGARVRILGYDGWGDGRLGTVVAHHIDGVAFHVRVDGNPETAALCLDPVNVNLAHESAA